MSSGQLMRYSKTIGLKGFSLIQMAMLVAVAGIILVSILPGGERASEVGKEAITRQHMEAIEKATQAFMATNLRRPCPADATLATSAANFGVEAQYPGHCNGTPSANFFDSPTTTATSSTGKAITGLSTLLGIHPGSYVTGSNLATNSFVSSIDSSTQITVNNTPSSTVSGTLTFNTITAGMVPVKTLGLPEEYALDGYGRRIMYIVDLRATRPYPTSTITPANSPVPTLSTAPDSCFSLQSQRMPGAIVILRDDSNTADDLVDGATIVNNTDAADNTMWALISYGKSGHGAFPANGSTIAGRINVSGGVANSIPDAAEINAFINPTTNFTTQFTGKLVQQASDDTTPYKNLVWYSPDTKNTCCVGRMCNAGFDIRPAGIGTANNTTGLSLATGDINGDGIMDLVVGMNELNVKASLRVYVVFGRKTGWPIPLSSSSTVKTDIDAATDGTFGFYVRNGSSLNQYAQEVTTGDVNQDGYDDIIIGGSSITVVFGEATIGTNLVNNLSLNGANNAPAVGVTSSYGLMISYGVSGTAQAVTTADINGTGYKSLVFSGGSTSNTAWVVYDMPQGAAGTANSWLWSSFASGTPRSWNIATDTEFLSAVGFRFTTGDTTNFPITGGNFNYAAGDVDGDGDDDIIIGASSASSNAGKVYVLFSPFSPSAGPQGTLSLAAAGVWSLAENNGIYITQSGSTQLGLSVAVADINNDGMKDIITSDNNNIYIYNGRTSATWVTNAVSGQITAPSISIDTVTNRPTSWLGAPFPTIIKTGDVNNDGWQDLLLGSSQSATPSGCGKGSNTGSVYVLLQPPPGGSWGGGLQMFDSTNTTCDTSELNMGDFSNAGYINCAETSLGGTPSLCGFRIDGPTSADYAYIPAVGDLNADGKNDIFIAAPGFASPAGAVYTLWGRQKNAWEDVIDLNVITSQ